MSVVCITELLSITKDTVLIVTAISGVCVARKGLSTWNRQLKGGVEYDLTRRILKCTYKLREAIKGVRNPVIWGNEMLIPSESEASIMSKEQIRHFGLVSAYKKRLDIVMEVRADLQTEMLEAEALWGKDIIGKFDQLFKLQKELILSVHTSISARDPNNSAQSRDAFQVLSSKQREILYDLSSENPDEFTSDINRAIEEIELFLKPYLRK